MTDRSAGATSAAALPCNVSAPAAARRFARGVVGLNEHTDVIVLLVSELVTNVVIHTAVSEVQLQLRQFDSCVRVDVSDRDIGSVEVREADGAGGRGLRLVEALADRWGIDARRDGKTVWFEIEAGA